MAVTRHVLLLVTIAAQVAQAYMGGAASGLSKVSIRTSAPQMAAVPVVTFEGTKDGEANVDLKVAKSGAYIIQRKVVTEQANMRLGTACTKTRSDVRGGGRKPYKQKGTGRARRGSSRSPLLKGGGVTFGPKPKSYRLKMNKKEKRLAISTALMSAIPKMALVEDLDSHFTAPRTKDMKAFLDRLSVDTENRESTLVITKARHENTYLAARNIPYLNLMTLDNINARDLVKVRAPDANDASPGLSSPCRHFLSFRNITRRHRVAGQAKKVFIAKSAMDVMKVRKPPSADAALA